MLGLTWVLFLIICGIILFKLSVFYRPAEEHLRQNVTGIFLWLLGTTVTWESSLEQCRCPSLTWLVVHRVSGKIFTCLAEHVF